MEMKYLLLALDGPVGQPPFRAELIASSHSGLSGVVAGFAVAAVILLIKLRRRPVDGSAADEADRILDQRAAILLFMGFALGALASFMFSAVAGDEGWIAYYGFGYPSVVFAMLMLVIVLGLSMLFKTFDLDPQMLEFTRIVGYLVAILAVVRIWDDMQLVVRSFTLSSSTETMLNLIALGTIVASFGTRFLWRSGERWMEEHLFRAYCFVGVFIAFGLALYQGLATQHGLITGSPSVPDVLPVVLLACTCLYSAWTVLLLPEHKDEKRRWSTWSDRAGVWRVTERARQRYSWLRERLRGGQSAGETDGMQ